MSVEYSGINLHSNEVEVLREAERLTGEPIPAVEKIVWEELDESGIRLRKHQVGFIEENGYIVELGLSKRNSNRIPISIKSLSQLRVLDLSCPYSPDGILNSIPDWLMKLKQLKLLDLSNNRLTKLPDAIENLNTLEELHLLGNKLRLLPETIGNLNSLKRLILSVNLCPTINLSSTDFGNEPASSLCPNKFLSTFL